VAGTNLAAAVALAAAAAVFPAHGAAQRPSLLVVTLDTTRADRLGCYGARDAATPHLDRLSREGVRFARALSPAPLTLPSHATVMTGRVPRRHGVRNNASSPLAPDVPVLAGLLREAGYDTAAFVSAAVLDRRMGLARGFRVYDDDVRVGERSAFNYEERAAGQTNAAVLEHLESLKPPFFLWVHYFDPHHPYVPPEPFRTRFSGRPHDGEIAYLDEQIGRLLAAVREIGGPLLVVVAGDHGDSLGEHGEDTHGVFLYQSTQHVPWIMAGPGVAAGTVVQRNVGLQDLAPTVLDLVGLDAPPGTDGVSLAPLVAAGAERIESEGAAQADDYEMESLFQHFSYGWAPLRALVRGRWKYVDAPEPELYDLEADPAEQHNLWGGAGAIGGALRGALLARVARDELRPAGDDLLLAEQRERLESLGYVGGVRAAAPSAIDPKRAIAQLRDLDAARRALRSGDPRGGIRRLEPMVRDTPGNVAAALSLVQCYLAAGDTARALEHARRLARLDPRDDLFQLHLAQALAVEADRSEQAAAEAPLAYRRALELNPRRAETYLGYAGFLRSRGQTEQARKVLGGARQAELRDPEIEIELATLELARGEARAAEEALLRAVASNPCAVVALEALGRLALVEGRSARAIEHYERALACDPDPRLARTLVALREREAPPTSRPTRSPAD
jgi:arylsulfatase A-like enzyme/Tfp pilus assembly protein PilF